MDHDFLFPVTMDPCEHGGVTLAILSFYIEWEQSTTVPVSIEEIRVYPTRQDVSDNNPMVIFKNPQVGLYGDEKQVFMACTHPSKLLNVGRSGFLFFQSASSQPFHIRDAHITFSYSPICDPSFAGNLSSSFSQSNRTKTASRRLTLSILLGIILLLFLFWIILLLFFHQDFSLHRPTFKLAYF